MSIAAAHDALSLDSSGEEGKLHTNLDPSPETPAWDLSTSALRSSFSHGSSPNEKNAEDASPAFPPSPEDKQGTNNGARSLGAANTSSSPDSPSQTSQGLRASASSLPTSKLRFHAIQKGAGIGKHPNGRGVGRSSKLAQLEVAAEHISASSHHVLLTSPRLLRSPGRKKSPIRWFPRKKSESYLERKIRMLQEKEGNVASLVETLGAANLHLSRIEREKLAAQAAAAEAMDSRKGALVEASWCRILKLAGIPCISAIQELQKAEKKAAAALAEAENHGVILHHGPAERESSSEEAVTASLDTAFDVDKEVTAAIKVALRHVSSTDERECDAALNNSGDMLAEGFSEAESQSDPETKEDSTFEELIPQDQLESPRKSLSSRPCSQKQDKLPNVHCSLVSLMVGRIRDLSLEHQTALAGVVATRGLSALLKEQSLDQELNEKPAEALDCKHSHALGSPNKASDLGSILVKHVSRLQREVQAAKESSRQLTNEGDKRPGGRLQRVAHVESLDQILVKHVSKLEKEKLAAKASRRTSPGAPETCKQDEEGSKTAGRDRKKLLEVTNTPYSSTTLGSILVKHVSALEKEKQAASKMQEAASADIQAASLNEVQSEQPVSDTILPGRSNGSPTLANEPLAFGFRSERNQRSNSSDIPGLDSILVKHVSRLEKEKQVALALQDAGRAQAEKPKQPSCEAGLGDVLVKRLSRLEMEKAKALESAEKECQINENSCPSTLHSGSENDEVGRAAISVEAPWQRTKAQKSRQMEGTWGGPSMLRDPASASISSNLPKRASLREKQLEDTWGGLSLGNTLKRHVSKLEKEQGNKGAHVPALRELKRLLRQALRNKGAHAAWRRAEEEARQRPNK